MAGGGAVLGVGGHAGRLAKETSMRRMMRTAAVVGMLGLLAAGGAGAQQAADPLEQAAKEAALLDALAQVEARRLPARFDLEFPGGPLTAYVAAVREKNPTANIILMGDVGIAAVPAITLRSVSTQAAIELLGLGQGESGDRVYAIMPRSVDNPGGEPVFVIEVHSESRVPKFPTTSETTVTSLAKLLRPVGDKALRVEDVLSAIEAAAAMAGSEPPTIRYHAETQLLLFRGSKAQADALFQTLNALERTAAALE